MGDRLIRISVAAALLLTWLLPMTRVAVLPPERAEALAADTVCRARWDPAPQRNGLPGATAVLAATPAVDPRLGDVAELFEPAMAREWRADVAQVSFVALVVVALLAGWRWAAGLAIAAAILYLHGHTLDWDGYRLLAVTGSPRLWWVAIQQWSAALWFERLIAPVMVWAAMLGSCAMLLQAVWARRADAAARSGRMLLHRPFA